MSFLEAASGDAEAGQSAYWRQQVEGFSVNPDGTVAGSTVLGSVSAKTGPLHTAAHWMLQHPYRRMGRGLGAYEECQRLGRDIAACQGRQFTHDMIRQALSLALIRQHVDLSDPADCNLVIGDGYGVMASLLMLGVPHRRCIAVNLTKPLLLDLACIRRALPETRFALVSDEAEMRDALADRDLGLIAVQADNAAVLAQAPLGLAINMVSMQEMVPDTIADYFRTLRANKARETAFYCCNKLRKKIDGGHDFDDYPWRPDDRVLHDGVCPWNVLSYTKWPPFWRRKKSRSWIWHRLAVMAKGD